MLHKAFVILIGLAFSCGSPSKKTSPQQEVIRLNPSELPEAQKNYQFTDAECSTGSHTFYGSDPQVWRKEYCLALLDETRNRNCARSQRHQQFLEDCKDLMPELSLTVDEEGFVTSLATFGGFKNKLAAELLLVNLWADSQKIYTDEILDTEHIREANAVAEKVTGCGLHFYGPACKEYRHYRHLASGILLQDGNYFYYHLSKYAEHTQQFLWIFPLSIVEAAPVASKVMVYFLDSKYQTFEWDARFTERADLRKILEINFSPLTRERGIQLMKLPEDFFQLMHLTSWLEESIVFDEQRDEMNAHIWDALKEHQALAEAEGDANLLIEYLSTIERLRPAGEFLAMAESFLAQENETLGSLAAAFLLKNDLTQIQHLPQAMNTLFSDYQDAVLLGLSLLSHDEIVASLEHKKQVVQLLNHPSEVVKIEAHKTLLYQGVDAALLKDLTSLFRVDSDISKKYAFLTIAASGLPEAIKVLLQNIDSFKDPLIKDEMLAILDATRYAPEHVEAISQLFLSANDNLLLYKAMDWLAQIPSANAYGAIIHQLQAQDWGIQNHASQLLETLTLFQENLKDLQEIFVLADYDTIGNIAKHMLKFVDLPSQKLIVERLSDEDEDIRLAIAQQLAIAPALHGELAKSLGDMLDPVSTSYPDVKLLLPEILDRFPGEPGTWQLARFIGHIDEKVRTKIIASLLRRIPIEDKAAMNVSAGLISQFPESRAAAAKILGETNSGASIQYLIYRLDTPHADIVPTLLDYLRQPNLVIVAAAISNIDTIVRKPGLSALIKEELIHTLNRSDLPLATRKLIESMIYTDLPSQKLAFDYLEKRSFTADMIPSFEMVLVKPNHPQQRWAFGWIRSFANDEKGTLALIKGLSAQDTQLRTEIMFELNARALNDQALASLRTQIISSIYQDVIEYCINALKNAPLANTTLEIVKSLETPDLDNKQTLIAILNDKNLDATHAKELGSQIAKPGNLPIASQLVDLLISIPIQGREANLALIQSLALEDNALRETILSELETRDLSEIWSETKTIYESSTPYVVTVTKTYGEALNSAYNKLSLESQKLQIIRLLAKIAETSTIRYLTFYWNADSPEIRQAAYDIIRKYKSLLTYTDYESVTRIRAALLAAAYVDTQRLALEMLIHLDQTIATAPGALIEISAALGHPDPGVRQQIHEYLLSKSTMPDVFQVKGNLKAQLQSTDPTIRIMAIRLLGRIGTPDAIQAIGDRQLVEQDPTVQDWIETVLAAAIVP